MENIERYFSLTFRLIKAIRIGLEFVIHATAVFDYLLVLGRRCRIRHVLGARYSAQPGQKNTNSRFAKLLLLAGWLQCAVESLERLRAHFFLAASARIPSSAARPHDSGEYTFALGEKEKDALCTRTGLKRGIEALGSHGNGYIPASRPWQRRGHALSAPTGCLANQIPSSGESQLKPTGEVLRCKYAVRCFGGGPQFHKKQSDGRPKFVEKFNILLIGCGPFGIERPLRYGFR